MPAPQPPVTIRPVLSTEATAPLAPGLYEAALHNLLDVNVVPARHPSDPPWFVRAGGGYAEPWTRDAAINAWGGASALAPEVARDTLRMVCGTGAGGRRVIAQDNQWWDQIIWVIAAWQHVLVTGDEAFLGEAFQIGVDSLEILQRDRFRPAYGLYAGGAVMQDGIAGYPTPPSEPGNPSTFVLDYPLAHELLSLSTNAVYVEALRSLAEMAELLGADPGDLRGRAAALTDAINAHLWSPAHGLYGYFVHGAGELAGTLDRHQEAIGLAFALMFGIADRERATRVLEAAHRERFGVVSVWPHFTDRFSDDQPGRHNVVCWPMIMGMFGDAAARAGDVAVFDRTMADLETLFTGSGNGLFELYNAQTGAVDGGWQLGVHWPSEPDQTWSATALLRMVHFGLFGIRYSPPGLTFAPCVPTRFAGSTLRGYPYRDALLDVSIHGSGTTLVSARLDDAPAVAGLVVPPALIGRHTIELEVA